MELVYSLLLLYLTFVRNAILPFPGHVAISLFGSLVVSLWEKPDYGDGKKNRIQIIDINDLPGRVQIGPPLTEAIKAGKI